MKKLLVVSALACLGVSAFAADGATLFKNVQYAMVQMLTKFT